ncbi:carboxymuconolactone decarboxylase family protein [Bordetella genomosp. 13]|uniref:carboxymuconolactone decarboxylase family protein n=1 Tax=Bordetella genomosp. 13 TaxID=463040 RepID=UPI0011A1BD1E|nr:carboxymuconolactone decarboxylase family protein [Bordetella genomosp. 13]
MTQRIDPAKASPKAYQSLYPAFAYFQDCSLPLELIDLAYLRVSQINGCAYCIDKHSADLIARGMPVSKLLLVPVWHEAEALFSAQERAALAWSESLTRLEQTGAPDEAYEQAAAVFSERELADLSIAIALMNAANRLGVGFRKTPGAVGKLAA